MSGASIDRAGLEPGYWRKRSLAEMSPPEWEALCDGCGKCCLNKLEDIATGQLVVTRLACRLFDDSTCRCCNYADRFRQVPSCVRLSPGTLPETLYWLPETCAYKRLYQGLDLPEWHPLISGSETSVHAAGASAKGRTLPEDSIPEDRWEDYPLVDDSTQDR